MSKISSCISDGENRFSNVHAVNDVKNLQSDAPCIDAGGDNWSAFLGKDGKTYYCKDNGKVVFQYPAGHDYSGPVNIINANKFTVTKGADVNGANLIGDIPPIVTVENGGKLENSAVYGGSIDIAEGGISENNLYVDAQTDTGNSSSAINGTSQGDKFIYSNGGFSVNTNLSEYPQFSVDEGSNKIKVGETGKVLDPVVINDSPSSTGGALLWLESGSYYGSSDNHDVIHQEDSVHPNISNDFPCLNGGGRTITAVKGNDGETYYSQDGGKTFLKDNQGNLYTGRINIYDCNLVVKKGANVDGCYVFSTSGSDYTVTIESGGKIQNSSIFNAILKTQPGSYSSHNKYYSISGSDGVAYEDGNFDNDTFYANSSPLSGSAWGSLNLTHPSAPSSPPINRFIAGSNRTNVTFDSSATINKIHFVNQSGWYITTAFETNVQECYLSGTLIRAENGDVAIEDLKVGDFIYTYQNGEAILKEVVNINKKHTCIKDSAFDDIARYPVRIIKGAFANNVPYKDMLVTPEHCLFINDQFIPVRMLVNGYSIYYDYSFAMYDYYHIELERHSVIMADGVLSESYLGNGNHGNGCKDDNIVSLPATKKTWETDAAAPLMTARDIVEPIFQQLNDRACDLGVAKKSRDICITDDPELCLLTDQGQMVYPHGIVQNKRYIFSVPANVATIYLQSLNSRPSDAIGPFVDDRRNLGVLVSNVTVFDRENINNIREHLEHSDQEGWHSLENNSCRWTEKNAMLSLGKSEHIRILVIEILAAGPYIKEEQEILKKMA